MSVLPNTTNKCVICETVNTEELTALTQKGSETLLEYCALTKNERLANLLESNKSGLHVHNTCRNKFTDKRPVKRLKLDEEAGPSRRQLRSGKDAFSWKEMCFLCGTLIRGQVPVDSIHSTCTLQIRETILKAALDRNDSWGFEVMGRLEICCDLPAEEAIYHHNCYVNFTRNKSCVAEGLSSGRHKDQIMTKAFDKLCEWLEDGCENEWLSLVELHARMKLEANTDEVYSVKHLKRKLIERYGNHIYFAEKKGRNNVVCFHDMCSFIISDKWYEERKANQIDDTERIIKTAAKLIAAQIREIEDDMKQYPIIDDNVNESKFVPPLLSLFLKSIVSSNLEQISLGECIVQAARPRTVITPICLGLGVELHHTFGSKFLIKQLARLGFCVSNDEIIRYKQSVVLSKPPGYPTGKQYPAAFTQWVADNVDHNIRTIDGYNTFHGMGIISATTCLTGKFSASTESLSRVESRAHIGDIMKGRGVPIVPYHLSGKSGLVSLTMRELNHHRRPTTVPPITNLNPRRWVSTRMVIRL